MRGEELEEGILRFRKMEFFDTWGNGFAREDHEVLAA